MLGDYDKHETLIGILETKKKLILMLKIKIISLFYSYSSVYYLFTNNSYRN